MKNIIAFKKINLNMLKNLYFAGCLLVAALLLCGSDVLASDKKTVSIPRQLLIPDVIKIVAFYWGVEILSQGESSDLQRGYNHTTPDDIIYEITHTNTNNPDNLITACIKTMKGVTLKQAKYDWNDDTKRWNYIPFFHETSSLTETLWNAERQKLQKNNQIAQMYFGNNIIPDGAHATFLPDRNLLFVADPKKDLHSREHPIIMYQTSSQSEQDKALNAFFNPPVQPSDSLRHGKASRSTKAALTEHDFFRHSIKAYCQNDNNANNHFYWALAHRVRPKDFRKQ